MTTSPDLVLQSIVGVTLAVLLVWAAAAVGKRRSAAFRNALWRGAVAAFWIVPLVCVAAAALPARTPAIRVPVPAVQVGAGGAPVAPQPGAATVASADGRVQEAPVRWTRWARWSTAPFGLVGGAVWALGALTGLGLLVRDALTVRRLLRTAAPTGGPAADRVAHWARALGLPAPPRSAIAPSVRVPTVAGLRRPTLLLPVDLPSRAPETDSVLIHEIAHVLRGDVWIQAAASVTRVLWWWHPLSWLVTARLASTAEECCDDWVISATGDRETYAGAVVRWAEAAHTAGTLACGSRGRALVRRVRRILATTSRPSVRLSAWAKAALAGLAVVVLAGAGALRVQTVPAATLSVSAPITMGAGTRAPSVGAPGTTIHVVARGEDDSRPVGARCTIALRDRQQAPDSHTDYDVAGADGDWTIRGVRAETWTVDVTAEGYAWYEAANTRQVRATGEGEQTVRLTLSRGGTLTGRVVADDTGEPIPRVLLTSGQLALKRDETDANGRYTLEHVAPAPQVVEAYWTPGFYVGRRSAEVTGKAAETVTVPDIRLPLGGIIEGRVQLPPEGCGECRALVTVTSERPVAPDLFLDVSYPSPASSRTFRLGPLPPGSYTIHAKVSHGKGPHVTPPHEWTGRLTGVTVKTKQTVQNVVVAAGPPAP
ncbi:MAG: hypothetical protein FJX75_04735 [Armatimonadetes bacterium]|nr:hypothetical protein [Armatimonadota bacterium]